MTSDYRAIMEIGLIKIWYMFKLLKLRHFPFPYDGSMLSFQSSLLTIGVI